MKPWVAWGGAVMLAGAAFVWFFGGASQPAAAVASVPTTFTVKGPEPTPPENIFTSVSEVLGAVAPTVKKFAVATTDTFEPAGEVLGASVTAPARKYLSRKNREEPLPPAPVLAATGCSASPCTLSDTQVELTWSATNGASNYQVLVNGTEAETTQSLATTVTLTDLATSTVQVVAVHGASGNGAGFLSNTLTVYIESPDIVAPVVDAHADEFAVAASTTATSTAVAYTLPAATDDRDGVVAVTCDPVSGSEFAVGTTTVECAATDTAGNTATTTFAVGVTLPPDLVAPVISTVADLSVEATSTNSTYAEVTYTLPTAEDETDGVLTPVCTPTSGAEFAVGTTTVECAATDTAGNTASTTFAVGVFLPVPPPPVGGALLEDNFDSGIAGWQIFGAFPKLFDTTSDSECVGGVGGCVVGGAFPFGTPKMHKQGDELAAGAFTIYVRQRNVSGAEPYGIVSLCTPGSSCDTGTRIDFQSFPYDNVWHQYLLAWRQGATAVESCKLTNNTNMDDCVWNVTAHPLGTVFDTVGLWSAQGYEGSSNNDVWFDEMEEYLP